MILIGAGGHAISLINVIETSNLAIEGIYDDTFDPAKRETKRGYPVLGATDDVPADADVVLAVGDNGKRSEFFRRFLPQIYRANLIHPSALIERQVALGRSNQVFHGAYLNSATSVGDNNIFNTRCILEHDTVVGDHNHIAVGAILCGKVRIGSRCFIGAGAVIIDGITLCDNVIVGAGSVVIKDITRPGVYAGTPAVRRK